jgi:hypothetical protein
MTRASDNIILTVVNLDPHTRSRAGWTSISKLLDIDADSALPGARSA